MTCVTIKRKLIITKCEVVQIIMIIGTKIKTVREDTTTRGEVLKKNCSNFKI